MVIIMTVLCLFLANNVTHARRQATYYVGGVYGWDTIIPMDTWARGKIFYAGDILGMGTMLKIILILIDKQMFY